MSKYIINWLVQLIDQLPSFLRKAKHINWLWALLAPLRRLGNQLIAFREAIREEISRNGQEINLEKILNDRFDPLLRRIYIEDEQVTTPETVWLINENQVDPTLWLISEIPPGVTLPLKTIEEHGQLGGFIVWLPTGLVFDLAAMEAILNKYKLAGLHYKIMYV